MDVECSFGDVDLDLGDDATLELTKDNTFAARIDGVPLGSQCTVTEQGQPGSFGETSRSGTPTTVQVLEPTDPTIPADDQEVPEAQIATITNDYQFTGLSVTKQVRTKSTGAVLGPFTFSLTCTSITNKPVTFDDNGATRASFSLKAGETWNAPADRIPVGASCTLVESDSAASDGITFTGDNVVDNGDGTATIKPGTEPVKVEVTNAFDAGTMTLAKVVDGPGGGLWGAGPFTFDVTCTYRGQSLFNGKVVLQPNGTRTLGPYPGGTRCTVVESGSAGATVSTLVPADGVVTIPKKSGSGEVTNVTVTARNTFDLTSLDAAKVVTGDLNAPGAARPFVVSLSCTWLVEGQRVPFAVPGGPERELEQSTGTARRTTRSLPARSAP